MVFTDMDGVVAKYECASFVEREDGSFHFRQWESEGSDLRCLRQRCCEGSDPHRL